jgi:hypothetical protein
MNNRLAAQLMAMQTADQAMRNRAHGDISKWDVRLDKKHTKKLKEIVNRYGWPTVSLVGPSASNAAWLLVQHADHDIEFQEKCLLLMKSVSEGEVRKPNIAYLEDRVRVARGEPQLYGTQFDQPGKNFGPKSVADKGNVDARRKSMGLGTLAEYKQQMLDYYKQKS